MLVPIVSALHATSESLLAMWFARRMRVSSPFVMTPLPSSSLSMNANLSLSSLPAPTKLERAIMNSRTSICPLFS